MNEKKQTFFSRGNNYLLGLISHLFGEMDLSIPIYPHVCLPAFVLGQRFHMHITYNNKYELAANNNNEQFVASVRNLMRKTSSFIRIRFYSNGKKKN